MKRYRKIQQGGGLLGNKEHEQGAAPKTTGMLKLLDVITWVGFLPLHQEPKLQGEEG